MDTQRKKGVLEVCVLASLQNGPSYGYRIAEEVSHCIEISESTLYPILRRLEAGGCVSSYTEEYHGRLRKYYRLETKGRQKITEFLSEAVQMKQIYAYVEKGEISK